jgi:lysophospholipase L1-like esterase
MEYPPLPQTWDHYDPETSRLANGLLVPEPDYVFCMMGTNDHVRDGDAFTLPPIREDYEKWVVAVRKACPQALIFCVVPPLGWHGEEIAALVAARNKAGDKRVFLIETAPVKDGYNVLGVTAYAEDGVHPSGYGNAVLGALVAVEAQKHIGVR